MEEGLEFGGGGGIGGDEVFGFCRVVAEVIELSWVVVLAAFGPSPAAGTVDEFPWTAADGEHAADGMVDEVGMGGFLRGFAAEVGCDAEAVGGRAGWERGTAEIGGGGKEGIQADGVVTDRSGGRVAGPADEEGDAVTTFPDVGFGAAPWTMGDVAAAVGFPAGAVRGGSVVACEDDDGVVRQIESVEGIED